MVHDNLKWSHDQEGSALQIRPAETDPKDAACSQPLASSYPTIAENSQTLLLPNQMVAVLPAGAASTAASIAQRGVFSAVMALLLQVPLLLQ